MSKIRAVICRVGQEPAIEEIDNGLAAMQGIVDGYIQCIFLEPGVILWCNEEDC